MLLPLAAYGGPVAAARWVPHPGGFSGARVFAGHLPPTDPRPVFALKAHPPGVLSAADLARIHDWQRAAEHLPFVPRLVPNIAGRTVTGHAGRLWELAAWMPGAPAALPPTIAQVTAAAAALAQLHRAWQPLAAEAPFPAVERRVAILRRVRPLAPAGDEFDAARAARPEWATAAIAELAPWAGRRVAVHPCLCDVHRDHILFTGDAVTGAIDSAAMKLDHPAVDLARLFGDWADGDAAVIDAGLAAYRAAGGADVSAELVTLLDRTGAVCAAARWLAMPAVPAAAEERLRRIVGRLIKL